MTKTLNQIIIFFFHRNQNIFSATLGIRIFFQQHWESEYFFENSPSPPLEAKCSVPKAETKRNDTQQKRNETKKNHQ